MSVHAALQALYRLTALGEAAEAATAQQPTKQSGESTANADLLHNQGYKAVYQKCQRKNKIVLGGQHPPVDPHDNTQQATYTTGQLTSMAKLLISSTKPEAARQMSMLLCAVQMAGRGDELRNLRLCDMTEPRLRSTIGKQPV